jgi:hypothetical protein
VQIGYGVIITYSRGSALGSRRRDNKSNIAIEIGAGIATIFKGISEAFIRTGADRSLVGGRIVGAPAFFALNYAKGIFVFAFGLAISETFEDGGI